MPAPETPKKGTNQFMRQGHTAGAFGNDPAIGGQGEVEAAAKDLKP